MEKDILGGTEGKAHGSSVVFGVFLFSECPPTVGLLYNQFVSWNRK